MTTITKPDPRLMGISGIATLGDCLLASNPHRRTLVTMTTGNVNGVRVLGETDALDSVPGPVVAFGTTFWCLDTSGDLTEWTQESIPVLIQTISVGASSAGWLVVCGDFLLVPIGHSGILVLDSTGAEVDRIEGAMRRIQRLCASDDGTMLYLFDGAGVVRMLAVDSAGEISGIGLDVSVPDAVDVRGCVFDSDLLAFVTGMRLIVLDLTDPEVPAVDSSTEYSEQLRGICRLAAGSYFLSGRDRILAQDFRASGSHGAATVAGVLQVTQPTTGRLTSETAGRDSDGSVQDTDVVTDTVWGKINRAQFNGEVRAVLVIGTTLYLGGTFTSVTTPAGTYGRTMLAAFDLSTGLITSWAPSVTGTSVECLVANDTSVAIGGEFSGLAGETRNNFGEVTSGGAATNLNPDFNGPVFAAHRVGIYFYAFGNFSTVSCVGGGPVTFAAEFWLTDPTTQTFSWTPVLASTAYGVAYDSGSSTHYVIGYGYAIKIPSGTVVAWETVTSAVVHRAITLAAGVLYVGSRVETIETSTRHGFAASTTGGVVQPFAPVTDRPYATSGNPSGAILVTADGVYIGADFEVVNGTERRLVALVTTAGVLVAWDAMLAANGSRSRVNALAAYGTRIIMAGTFVNPLGGKNIYIKDAP